MSFRPSLSYYETHTYRATLAGHAIKVVSKHGLPHPNATSPAQRLLAEAVMVLSDARVLLVDTGSGALAVALARKAPRATLALLDTNAIALDLAPRTLALNGIEGTEIPGVTIAGTDVATFDIAVFEVPHNRKLARRRLVEIHAGLRDGGTLLLAGANNEGIQSVIDDARALFGNAAVLHYRERNRVARAVKNVAPIAPIWASEPGIARGTWYEFDATVAHHTWRLRSLPGVFSYDRIDEGTALLLANAPTPRGLRVLDVGCGYGTIGLWAAAEGASTVDMVDVNLLAVASAQENIAALGFANARALSSDALGAVADHRYDLVVTNPPFHAGKSIDYEAAHAFISHARSVLVPGGRLVLVANVFIPYERVIANVFGRIQTLARTNRFQVLAAS